MTTVEQKIGDPRQLPGKSSGRHQRTYSAMSVTVAALVGALTGAAILWLRAGPAETNINGALSPVHTNSDPTASKRPAGVPKLSVQTTTAAVQLNTSAADYDPWRLRLLVGPDGLFEQEGRDEHWAPAVETWVTRNLVADVAKMIPEVEKVTFTCKTSTCKLTWWPSNPSINERMTLLYKHLYSGSARVGDPKGNEHVSLYVGGDVFKDVELGNPESLTGFLASRREKFLSNFSDPQKWQNPLFHSILRVIPADKWPKR